MSRLVSVIMTIYNKPKWLNEAIDSVLNQTYENWQLLLMEDNSPNPEVRRIIESYNDPRIEVHYSDITEAERYKTARYATLINDAGFRHAKGDYYTYLTDDDFYYPHRLQTMVDGLEADHVSVVYGAQQIVDADGGKAGVRGPFGILTGYGDNDSAFNKVDHNSVMHTRKSFFDADGWYDVPGVWGGADAYFWRRLHEAGYTFYPVSDSDNPLEAKRYHTESVQWLMSNNLFGV